MGERERVGQVRSRRTFRVVFITALLVIVGSAALLGVYVIMQERSGIPQGGALTSILFSESTYTFPLENYTPLEVKRLLNGARIGNSATLGAITRFIPTISKETPEGTAVEQPVTLEEFLQALGTHTPPDLVRALSSDFFFGIHTVDENVPLFVIPVVSYERAFAGMLNWEQSMNADFSPVFTPVPGQVVGPNGLPEKRAFEDMIMRNYDVRALRDDAGVVQLYYSFPTQHILVIGESVYSFTEVLNRLRAERKL